MDVFVVTERTVEAAHQTEAVFDPKAGSWLGRIERWHGGSHGGYRREALQQAVSLRPVHPFAQPGAQIQ